jgi:hypothetical protein
MAGASFRVTDRRAPRRAADPHVAAVSARVVADIQAGTPVQTGRLRSGWRVVPGRVPAVRLLVNDVPYARFVEYGTRTRPATPAAGRALARWRS